MRSSTAHLIVLGLFKSAILKPNLSNAMFHSTLRAQLTGTAHQERGVMLAQLSPQQVF